MNNMTTKQIAQMLVDLCRQGDFATCYEQLYSPDCISIEPKGAMMEIATGMTEINEKGKNWNSQVAEMHGAQIDDPIVAGNFFSCRMWNDITFKNGERIEMDEICLYEVKDGKIVKEQFFY